MSEKDEKEYCEGREINTNPNENENQEELKVEIESEYKIFGHRVSRKIYNALSMLKMICIGLVFGILLVTFVIQRNDVHGSSMEPTLHEDDIILVEMISHHFRGYKRGDIITFDASDFPNYNAKSRFVKRVIGVPGDTVELLDGFVYVNGEQLDEPYLQDEGLKTFNTFRADGNEVIELKEKEYYCLGDNRNSSLDSRGLGPFPEDKIKGHAIIRIFPFNQMRIL